MKQVQETSPAALIVREIQIKAAGNSLVGMVAVETKDNTVLPECEKTVLRKKAGGSEINAAIMESRIVFSNN